MFKIKFTPLQLPDKIPDKLPKIKKDSAQDKLLNFGLLTARGGYESNTSAGNVRRLSALTSRFNHIDKNSWPFIQAANTRVYCLDVDTKVQAEIDDLAGRLAKIPNSFHFTSYSGRPKILVALSDPCLTDEEAVHELSELTGITDSTYSAKIDRAGLNGVYMHPLSLEPLTKWIQDIGINKPVVSKRLVEAMEVKAATPYDWPSRWDSTTYLLYPSSNEFIRDFVMDFLGQYGQSDISSLKLSATLHVNQRDCSRVLKRMVADKVIELVDGSYSPGRKARTYKLPGVNVLPTAKPALKTPPKRANDDVYEWTNKLIRYAVSQGWDFDQLAKHIEVELGPTFNPSKLKSLQSRFNNLLKKR